MSELKITLEIDSVERDVSFFELGNIEIRVDDKIISSRNRTPDQSFMLFASLDELLDGLYLLQKDKEYLFNGIDSSFKIHFIMLSNSTLELSSYGVTITIDFETFIKTLIVECQNLLRKYSGHITDDQGIMQGLENSIEAWVKLTDSI